MFSRKYFFFFFTPSESLSAFIFPLQDVYTVIDKSNNAERGSRAENIVRYGIFFFLFFFEPSHISTLVEKISGIQSRKLLLYHY